MQSWNEFDAGMRTHYQAERGFYGREALPTQTWLWNDNGTLKAQAIGTTGTVGFKLISDGTTTTGMIGLEWEATADNTDVIQRNWSIPDTYARSFERTGMRGRIMLRARVRKLDTTGSATENGTLQLKADVAYHCPTLNLKTGAESDGDALFTAITGVVFKTIADHDNNTADATSYIPAKAAAANPAGFRWMEADISAALTSAQMAALVAAGTMGLKVYPSAAIGTALALQITDLEMVFTENAQPANHRNKALCTRA